MGGKLITQQAQGNATAPDPGEEDDALRPHVVVSMEAAGSSGPKGTMPVGFNAFIE